MNSIQMGYATQKCPELCMTYYPDYAGIVDENGLHDILYQPKVNKCVEMCQSQSYDCTSICDQAFPTDKEKDHCVVGCASGRVIRDDDDDETVLFTSLPSHCAAKCKEEHLRQFGSTVLPTQSLIATCASTCFTQAVNCDILCGNNEACVAGCTIGRNLFV